MLAGEYVEQVKQACKEFLPPNDHRLFELTMHTLPSYGNVDHVADLRFEEKHEILRRGILHKTDTNLEGQLAIH